ncbi:hypothetical protein QVD17_16325 [Tagetes erecta]|uniref:Uncharacterized protein n=1 Tax=Tagetes erecta TaxID=13708 RepID=A0AAD8KQQ0_TARER|nr:hypothetical protein QVD17_16325 [Tagetes erecta]
MIALATYVLHYEWDLWVPPVYNIISVALLEVQLWCVGDFALWGLKSIKAKGAGLIIISSYFHTLKPILYFGPKPTKEVFFHFFPLSLFTPSF